MKRYKLKLGILILSLTFLMSTLAGCGSDSVNNKNNTMNNSSIQENTNKNNTDNNSSNDTSKDSTSEKNTNSEEVYESLVENLNISNVMSNIELFASEEYDGRLTGTEQNLAAAKYISDSFESLGLSTMEGLDDYTQEYTQFTGYLNEAPKFQIRDKDNSIVKEFTFLNNFNVYALPYLNVDGSAQSIPYVIKDISELKQDNEDLFDKIILVSDELATDPTFKEALNQFIFSSPPITAVVYEKDLTDIRQSETGYFSKLVRSFPPYTRSNSNSYFYCQSDSNTFAELVQASNQGHSLYIDVHYSIEEKEVPNVIGVIEGTDETLKNEYLILSGHFDHIGSNKNGTYNPGAFDNASGTASVMEMARILSTLDIKPKKTILFVAFNGEEEGLIGSKFFAENAPFDITKSTMINLDMIGHKAKDPLMLYSTKDSQLLTDMSKLAEELGMNYIMEKGSRSDHTYMEMLGGEALTLIEFHLGEYHSPKDVPNILDSTDMENVIKLVLKYIGNTAY